MRHFVASGAAGVVIFVSAMAIGQTVPRQELPGYVGTIAEKAGGFRLTGSASFEVRACGARQGELMIEATLRRDDLLGQGQRARTRDVLEVRLDASRLAEKVASDTEAAFRTGTSEPGSLACLAQLGLPAGDCAGRDPATCRDAAPRDCAQAAAAIVFDALAGAPEALRLVDFQSSAPLTGNDVRLLQQALGAEVRSAIAGAVEAGAFCGRYALKSRASALVAYQEAELLNPSVGTAGTGRIYVARGDSSVVKSTVIGGCFQCSGYWTVPLNEGGSQTATCHGTVTEVSCTGYSF